MVHIQGWLTLDSRIVWAVVNVTLGKHSYLDQTGYILPWTKANFQPQPPSPHEGLYSPQRARWPSQLSAEWPPLAEALQNLQKEEYLFLPYNFTIPCPLTSTSTFITPVPPSQPHSAPLSTSTPTPLSSSSSSLPHCFFSPNSSLPPLVLSPLHTSQESIYPSWLLL